VKVGLAYWEICVEESLGEHGVTASREQIAAIAKDMESARGMEGEACGYYNIPNPERAEIKYLEAALKKERGLIFCRACNGTGRLRYNAGPWGVDTQCDTCQGNGKHA
jgi:hypothetical protein